MNETKLQPYNFPLWWYGPGLAVVWRWVKERISYRLRSTGFMLFIRHLRDPLYGDYTRAGRIISFFLRIVLLGFKLFWIGINCLALGFILLLYILLPAMIIVEILYQVFPF